MTNIFLSMLIVSLLCLFQCGDTEVTDAEVQDYEAFVIGAWEGVIRDDMIIEGKDKSISILFRVVFAKNGYFEMEERHAGHPENNSKRVGKYSFIGARTVEFSGLKECLDIRKISRDEMSLELNAREKSKMDIPAFVSLKLKRTKLP